MGSITLWFPANDEIRSQKCGINTFEFTIAPLFSFTFAIIYVQKCLYYRKLVLINANNG